MTVQRRSAFLRISLSDLASTRVARRRGAGTTCTTEGRIRTGRWAGSPVGVQNYGSTREASTRKYLSEVSHITAFWGFWASRRRQPRLGKKNRRLRDLPAGHIEAGDICEVHLDERPGGRRGRGGPEQRPHGLGGGRHERLAEDGELGDGAGEAGEHLIELGVLARLRELPGCGLLDVAVGAPREIHPLCRAVLEAVRVHRAPVGRRRLARRVVERRRPARRRA